MTLTVRPDPGAPGGGHAIPERPTRAVSEAVVSVVVQDAYAERWLGSDGDWRGERHAFGPSRVARDGDVVRIHAGPEGVDFIFEYAVLKIGFGGASGQVTWPDNVPPRPPVAGSGDMSETAAKSAAKSAADPCSAEALAARIGGFDETGRALRGCAGKVRPDLALRLIEDAAVGRQVPAFQPVHVHDRQPGWVRVGRSASRGPDGWARTAEVVPWKHNIVAAFTNPAGRQRQILFRNEASLRRLMADPPCRRPRPGCWPGSRVASLTRRRESWRRSRRNM